jgi:gluconolactonase
VLARGVGFTEGPIVTETGAVVFTSIDQGVLYLIDERGEVSVLALTGGGPNGACDYDGTYFVAQNGGNWMVGRERGLEPPPPAPASVQRIDAGGVAVSITEEPHAPNDLCAGPDGLVYVTDPTRRRTYDDGRIWRVDRATGESELLYELDWFPNGIAFGPEEDAIYVASTGAQRIVRLPTDPRRGRRDSAEVVIEMPSGHPDGLAFDVDGHVLVCAISKTDAPGEIQVWDTAGTLLDGFSRGRANMTTTAAVRGDGTLVVTDSDGGCVLAVDWPVAGAALFPRRLRTRSAPEIAAALRAGRSAAS